jgi:hypothetical protein
MWPTGEGPSGRWPTKVEVEQQRWNNANETWVNAEIAVSATADAIDAARAAHKLAVATKIEAEEVATNQRYRYLDAIRNAKA